MSIQIVNEDNEKLSDTGEYIAVRTCKDPFDSTMTLATIERVVEKTVVKKPTDSAWHVKTLVNEKPMSPDAALGFATRYAERKHIPVIYTASDG